MYKEGKYWNTYTSTASDITPLYRLTPNALLMYFQDSFARMMTIHHAAAFDIVKQRRMWVITEVQMDIQPTATFWSEDFTVELWVSELTPLRVYSDFRVLRKDNGRLIASGVSQWNILNLDTRRLETTDFLADRLTVVPDMAAGGHKKVRIPKPKSWDMQTEHRATRLDLDFNFHVSNRSYVSLALLTMPDEVLSSQSLSSIAVRWLHETYLDDLIVCRMSRLEDGGEQSSSSTYVHTLANADGVAVCEVLSRWRQQTEAPDVSVVLNREM